MERREAFITGVVLVVACLLITMIVAVGIDRGTGRSSVATGSGPRDDTGGDLSDDEAAAEELDAFVTSAMAFIEETRGRAFVSEPEVLALSDSDFVARVDGDLAEQFADDPEIVDTYNAVYRAIGLIAADDRVDDAYRAFGAAGVLGFYDPASDELVVRQVGELSLLTKSTIVHELAHAFDDQHFDLDRPEYDDRTDEVPWTFQAVAEGSASWVEARWEERLNPADQSDLLAEELGFADPSVFDRFELSFLIYELSPYDLGEAFVAHVVADDGPAGLDAVLETPPATSEQLIDPTRFDAGEPATAVEVPTADGDPVFEGVGGNALIGAIFQGNGVFRTVEWGGDQMSVWVDGDESCMRWHVEAETEAGFAELYSGFEEWADRVGGATITEVDALTVGIDRCI